MFSRFRNAQKPLRSACTLLIVALTSALALRAQGTTPTFTNVSVHDPSVIKDGPTYYILGSFLASASTTDLMNWTQVTSGWDVSTNPTNSLIKDGSPQTQFADALAYAHLPTDPAPPGFWGPDWIKLGDGRYYLYYSVCNGTSRAALGLAVANAVTGPYSNVGILLESGMWGLASPDGTIYNNAVHPNVVDPSVFFDQAGKLWMVYGSYSGGIFILSLDPGTGRPYAGQAYGKKLIGGNNCTIEGSYIVYSPETSYYYLFCTFGGLAANGGYNIRLGRSRNPDGPYLDAAGNDLTNVKGAFGTVFDNASIAPYGVKLMGNCQFLHVAGDAQTTSRGYVSPGGVSITHDPATGKYLMVFHTRFVGQGEYHEVRVHQLFLNADGWFVVAPQRYAQETMATTDAGQIPGDYKLINHGKDIAATVKTSSVITLNADRSVTGAVTGTWALSGDHDATLTLAGTGYRGVFSRQWDDDNQMWVPTFSALSGDGVAVWGSKVTRAAALAITTQPVGQSVNAGQPVTLTVATTGTPAPTYQWFRNGANVSGATGCSLTIASASANDAGNYTVVVTNRLGSVTSAAAALTVAARPVQVFVPNGDRSAQIVNLSTRGIVATGENVLIAGFVIAGPAPKQLLILASGLNLAHLGVTGEVGRPRLELYQNVGGSNVLRGANSDWQEHQSEISPLVTRLGAQPFAVSSDPAHGDAGLVVTLNPGVYSVVVSPAATSANQDGVGLIEIYDANPNDGSRLVNISSRGRIETGTRQMIVGVVIGGTGRARVMIRGVGPTLKTLGIAQFLANPSQALVRNLNGVQSVIATNDDWWNSPQADQIGALAPQLGAFDLGAYSADSVILQRLDPGVYSAVISPGDATPGVALAEIYDAYAP